MRGALCAVAAAVVSCAPDIHVGVLAFELFSCAVAYCRGLFLRRRCKPSRDKHGRGYSDKNKHDRRNKVACAFFAAVYALHYKVIGIDRLYRIRSRERTQVSQRNNKFSLPLRAFFFEKKGLKGRTNQPGISSSCWLLSGPSAACSAGLYRK